MKAKWPYDCFPDGLIPCRQMFTKTMSGVLKTIRTALPSFDSHESQRKNSADEQRPVSVSYKYNVHVMCGTDEQVRTYRGSQFC